MPSNAPFGFRPLRHMSGGDANRCTEHPIATGYTTALYPGDVVKLLDDGTIALAAAGDRILGVFQGVQFKSSAGETVFGHWPASQAATEIKAKVVTDPNVTFEVMSAGTPAQTNVGNLADHVVGTGNAYTQNSAATLSGTMTSAVAGFRILKIVDKPGNSGQYAVLEVQIVEHELSHHSASTEGV